jgi:hypothetical protein
MAGLLRIPYRLATGHLFVEFHHSHSCCWSGHDHCHSASPSRSFVDQNMGIGQSAAILYRHMRQSLTDRENILLFVTLPCECSNFSFSLPAPEDIALDPIWPRSPQVYATGNF